MRTTPTSSGPPPAPRPPSARARWAVTALVALVALLGAACADDDSGEVALDDSAEAADAADQAAPAVETASDDLAAALEEAGLSTVATAVRSIDVSEIVGSDEFTFFAPNDDAFLALDAETAADLLADPTQLLAILRNHAVDQRIEAAALADMTDVTTVEGSTLPVGDGEGGVTVGEALVVESDIAVGDGVVHVIDGVLLPG
jgi:uncharacterized surface protein with fasciclin (FAS1) repeats